MKKNLLLLLCFFVSAAAFSQTSSFILSGGWAVALPNYSDVSVNGYKINGQWEKAVIQEHWGMGIEASYINFKEIGNTANTTNSTNKYRTVPLTFYGKYLIGNDKLQAYAKVGTGPQLSTISIETANLFKKDHSFGIAATAGAGVNYVFTEYLTLNLDYEFLYITNSAYNNGMMNSVTLGIGFKLN